MSESRIWFQTDNSSSATRFPVVMDHNGQVASYLKTRFRNDELPFAKGVDDDFLQNVIDAETVVHQTPKGADLPPVGINEYLMPTGASRFGRGLFLVDNAHIETLIDLAWDVSFDGSGDWPNATRDTDTIALDTEDANGGTWTTYVFVLPPIQVDSAFDDRQLWIVPVVDWRYRYLHTFLPPEDLDVDSTTTWQNLIDRINTAAPNTIGVLPNAPDSAYLQPDPGYFSVRRSLAYAIDHIAVSVGMKAVMGFQGTLFFQTPTTAAAELTAFPEPQVFGATDNARPDIPTEFCLSHRRLNDHYDNETWTDKTEVPPGDDGPSSHVASTFYLEFYDEQADTNSEAARNALAAKISSDYVAWHSAYSYKIGRAHV